MAKPHECMVKAINMNLLEELLSSRTRAAIFGLLFGVKEQYLHIREIERRSGFAVGSVRQEALKLVRLGLVVRRKSGNRTYYEPNKNHPLYVDIRRIVLKTSGLAEALADALGEKGIQCAFVFGSLAAGTEQPESDVDLMIIGDIGLREASKRLAGMGDGIGREINSHVMTPEEFDRRRRTAEHFVSSVMASPRIWVKGSEDDLEAVVR